MSHLCQVDNTLGLRLVNKASRVTAFSEVFTPPEVVNQLLDMLEAKTWSDPKTVLVENTCGDGAFVIPILRRRFAGLTNKHRSPRAAVAIAIGTVWGIDLQADNVAECRANVLRAVLTHLYPPSGAMADIANDIAFVAAVVAVIEHQIHVGDGLVFQNVKGTFLMLPPSVQAQAAQRPLILLRSLLAGAQADTWLASVFRPAEVDWLAPPADQSIHMPHVDAVMVPDTKHRHRRQEHRQMPLC